MAGRRVTGVMQVLLAVTGITLTLIWFISYVIQVAREMAIPPIDGAHLWMGLAGVFLFAAAWLWALVTSLQILRAARKTNA